MTAPLVIGIAIVRHAGRYLVGVRAANGPLPGKAEFPGGKCLPGEPPEVCAVRECLEETGLAVEAETSLERRTHTYPHATVDLHFWLCRPVREDSVRDTHQGFRWVDADELRTLNFPEANAAVVETLSSAGEVR